MSYELVIENSPRQLDQAGMVSVPVLFTASGEKATFCYLKFFTANIRNLHTRAAYGQAVRRFSAWCEKHGLRLEYLNTLHIAAYVEQLGQGFAKPTVKQHLAAIRMLFDYLVIGQVIPLNPASAVRGPKYVLKTGKTPVLTREEMRQLFDSIVPPDEQAPDYRPPTMADLRDRALIGVLVYSFARISAVLSMNVDDYHQQGKRWWLSLHEKGGKDHRVPLHHKAEIFLDAYLDAAGLADQNGTPLFRSLDRRRRLSVERFDRREALAMIKRRSQQAGLGDRLGCHSFRATGITAYLQNGGLLEHAQAIASHESPRTTKLYDRTGDQISLDEIEKIIF